MRQLHWSLGAKNMDEKYHMPLSVLPEGFEYPDEYESFVAAQRVRNGSINHLPPWVFSSDETWAFEESKNIFGVKLVPFAQAEHMDMLVYFNAGKSSEVWVANPWDGFVIEKFHSFSSWLSYASEISSRLIEDKPQYKGKEFWFPKSA